MKAAAAVAEILKREGIRFLIGYPVNPIIEAAAEADIRTIIVRQERTGLHMADAVSRISSGQRIGVFAMQHGPGTENAFGGVAQAYGDSVPLVVLPGGYPRGRINIAPNFSAFLNYQHVTKWAEQVQVAAAAPALAEALGDVAFRLAPLEPVDADDAAGAHGRRPPATARHRHACAWPCGPDPRGSAFPGPRSRWCTPPRSPGRAVGPGPDAACARRRRRARPAREDSGPVRR